MEENKKLKSYGLTEVNNLKVHGRTTGCLSPLTLFWTGSALELNTKGTELWIEVEADYESHEPWIAIMINSVMVSRMMVTAGRHWICVFRGIGDNAVKNIRIVKEVQAMSGDAKSCLQIHAVKFDGEFMPIAVKPYKIEFVGDSITSGEGCVGATCEEDWISMWFSAVNNYSYLTAKNLDADYRVLSQSGWGAFCGWDNNPSSNMPNYYEKICGLLNGEKNIALGALEDNNFTAWQPDVVVVNLGTNDAGAFNSPAWVDLATGKEYKQRLNEDGSYNLEDLHAFESAVENFLYKLRNYNANAYIVWAYGVLGIPLMPAIYRAVDAYIKKTGDRKVSVFQIPNTTEETFGARWHPGIAAHEKVAMELSDYIKPLLKETL